MRKKGLNILMGRKSVGLRRLLQTWNNNPFSGYNKKEPVFWVNKFWVEKDWIIYRAAPSGWWRLDIIFLFNESFTVLLLVHMTWNYPLKNKRDNGLRIKSRNISLNNISEYSNRKKGILMEIHLKICCGSWS